MNRLLIALLLACFAGGRADADPINAVVGDASWRAHSATSPDAASEVARIRVHLDFVADLLESTPRRDLTKPQEARRRAGLEHLRAYAARGLFPRRTDDAFVGRRPRFIDDRGVHCAVGELLRVTGYGELASDIDAAWEYGYVLDISDPRLDSWAAEHGFTRRELAMIQPSYDAPPTARSVRADVEDMKDSLTLKCGREHAPPRRLGIAVRGDDHGLVVVKLRGKPSAFGRCFVDALTAHGLGAGGAWDTEPRAFAFDTQVALHPPEELVRQRIERIELRSTGCAPRPGPLARLVDVTVHAGRHGVIVNVATTPRNREVEACVAEKVWAGVADLGGEHWDVVTTRQSAIAPVFAEENLRQLVTSYVRGAGVHCHQHGAPKAARVRIEARIGGDSLKLHVGGGSVAFEACVIARVDPQLRSSLSVSRRLPDGTYERYFRVDAAADVTVDVPLESPEEAKKREEEMQRQIERERYENLY